MAETPSGSNEEKFVVVPLGDGAKKIGQVIGSESCRRILDALTTEPASASRLAEKMGLPLTTVQYDVEKLLEAGLIRVERVARSEKMREMKIYGPVRKLIVVVPERLTSGSPADILKKYLGVFLGILFVGALVEWAPGLGGSPGAPQALGAPELSRAPPFAPASVPGEAESNLSKAPSAARDVTSSTGTLRETGAGRNESALPAPPPAATAVPSAPVLQRALPATAPSAPRYGLWFVLGGTSALLLLGVAGWTLRKRRG